MTQQDLLYLMRRPQVDDLAVSGYGDRVYGTPEATLWNDAYERARARIENPRFLAPGITYEGRSGNIDAPEIVNEEVFQPLVEAFRPETYRDRVLNQAQERLDLKRQEVMAPKTTIGRLLYELDQLPEGDPRIPDYEAQIKKLAVMPGGLRMSARIGNPIFGPTVSGPIADVQAFQRTNSPIASTPAFTPLPTSPAGTIKRVRVIGPNGQRGTVQEGDVLPAGWSLE